MAYSFVRGCKSHIHPHPVPLPKRERGFYPLPNVERVRGRNHNFLDKLQVLASLYREVEVFQKSAALILRFASQAIKHRRGQMQAIRAEERTQFRKIFLLELRAPFIRHSQQRRARAGGELKFPPVLFA